MSQYCVYFLDDGGRVTGLSAALFDTDDDAGRWASEIADGRPMELWSPDHRIVKARPVEAAAARH